METLPSRILDSKHILQLLESLKSLSENAILTTADVTSLYTNIMHDDNIESVLHYTNLHADTLLPGFLSPHKIGILFETILKNNNVLFMNRHFLQLVVTAMGTKTASPYANLFLDCHKETIQETFIWAIILLEEIHRQHLPDLPQHYHYQSLQDSMNHLHPTMKFTFQHSTQQISSSPHKMLSSPI